MHPQKDEKPARRAPSPEGQRVKAAFRRHGVSIAAWAKTHNLSPGIVWRVLETGTGVRGESHRAAVLLGLKTEPVDRPDTFDPVTAAADAASTTPRVAA